MTFLPPNDRLSSFHIAQIVNRLPPGYPLTHIWQQVRQYDTDQWTAQSLAEDLAKQWAQHQDDELSSLS